MTGEGRVRLELADGAAWVTLERPEKLNALNAAMLDSLTSAVKQVAGDPAVRAVRLIGTGRGFCAGQDLGDRAAATDGLPDLGASLERHYNPIVRAMTSMPKPVVVAVNGIAAGAGANLALAGDLVVAAESATFIQSFARIGLVPDSGGTWLLPRLAGRARASGMALLGEPVSAGRALEWGLVWDVVADDDLDVVTADMTRTLAAGPTGGYGAIKQALRASAGNGLDDHLDLERDLQRARGQSADYREGVTAFLERRPPQFEGR